MYFFVVVLAYVFCHGVTSLLITPLQSHFLPEVTIFASFLYLPHGVRVLATWAYGWRAVPALLLGAGLSEVAIARARAFELFVTSFPRDSVGWRMLRIGSVRGSPTARARYVLGACTRASVEGCFDCWLSVVYTTLRDSDPQLLLDG